MIDCISDVSAKAFCMFDSNCPRQSKFNAPSDAPSREKNFKFDSSETVWSMRHKKFKVPQNNGS